MTARHGMLRGLAWVELLLSLPLLGLVFWPLSRWCTGRPLGFDCESWLIFAVNGFGPVGLLALVCSAWTIAKPGVIPQYVLLAGLLAVLAWWLWHWI